jgi:S-DNA-T family DNA segregation ATPase FtsK/SpoIIIE
MVLEWLVEEMERRYKRLSSVCCRNIEGYNESPEVKSGKLPKMYYIVMVFDEVGDYMAIAKKEIEDKVMRLAAKSRAAGIHLILTTQRPTVDVITGTIKANLPSRIAFAVNSYNDSKTILESAGAESLLGMGDMLFLPKGSNDMERIQCAFVNDSELMSVVNYIKENNDAEFDEEIADQMFNKKEGFDPTNGVDETFDPMLKECLKFFIKSKKASASSLQGYFAMGYPKANKIVLQMEKAGFVSPGDHNGRRTLYITEQEFEERFGESIDE